MPAFTGDELRDAIAEGKVQAISVDTSIFKQFGCNLKIPTLRKLDQFKNTDVSVVFSEIVVRETKKHISRIAEETRSRLDTSLRECKKSWYLNFNFDQILQMIGIDENSDEFAKRQFAEFGRYVGAEIIPVKGNVDIDELKNRYFDIEIPFESNAKKKAEFPDAMALLSLEFWAKQKGIYMLLVSADKGWQKFSDLSGNLICVEELEIALDHFNEALHSVAGEIVSTIQNGEAKTLSEDIDTIIQTYLNENDFSVNTDSGFYFEKEEGEAVLQSWQIPKSTQPRIIAYERETITFAVNIECVVDFKARLHIYIPGYDEYTTYIGSKAFLKKDDIQISSVLTITRETSLEPELVEANITTQEIEANFGELEVEPDWAYEE